MYAGLAEDALANLDAVPQVNAPLSPIKRIAFKYPLVPTVRPVNHSQPAGPRLGTRIE